MKSAIFRGLTMLALSVALIAGAVTWANAAPLHRLAADFQNNTSIGGSGEIVTSATPASGGLLVYSKALSIPFKVAYITFSAQGDVHNGSALLMQASVTDSSGVTTLCEPLAGQTAFGGGGPTTPHWYTLLNVPAPTTSTNCNNGGGGTGDCHDNTIMFSCCAQVTPDTEGDDTTPATTHTVKIRLADFPGGDGNFAFYERSTIYIDGSPNPGGNLCTGHGVP